MKLDKTYHTNICKYLWNARWKSWYSNFCLRWNNKHIDTNVYRTKTAYIKQREVESADTSSET